MLKERYDTTMMKKQYVKINIKNIRAQIYQEGFLAGVWLAVTSLIIYNFSHVRLVLERYQEKSPNEYLIFLPKVFLFCWIVFGLLIICGIIMSVIDYKQTKKGLGKYGIILNDKKLTIFWFKNKKEYLLSKVEFVYIDEKPNVMGYGWFVIKEKKDRKSLFSSSPLPTSPKNFWSKIPLIDILFNKYPTEILLGKTEEFVEALIRCGIKVYWRKKHTDYVEECFSSKR